MKKLIVAARCALADLAGMYESGSLETCQKQTIVDLYDALTEVGENVTDYQNEYEASKEDIHDEEGD